MVTVYVESNFILELAFLQEQHQACLRILELTEQGSIRLAVPAYCIGMPTPASLKPRMSS